MEKSFVGQVKSNQRFYDPKALGFFPIALVALLFLCPSFSRAQCTLTSATLTWAADDAGYLYINGTLVSSCYGNCWTGADLLGAGSHGGATTPITVPTSVFNAYPADNVIAVYNWAR